MRLDKWPKVSRLIKRRTVANEACDNERISANGRVVKASYDVKEGDKLEIRFGAKTAKEDEADLSKVSLSLELFEAYTDGYLSACAEALTKAEVDHLAFSAKLMTYECGVRFLTDYLCGDTYFKIDYPDHNLVRARNQFKLVSEIERMLPEMEAIVQRIYQEKTA